MLFEQVFYSFTTLKNPISGNFAHTANDPVLLNCKTLHGHAGKNQTGICCYSGLQCS